MDYLQAFNNPEHGETVRKMARRYRTAWRHLFESDLASGEFRSDMDVSLTIMAFEDMMNFSVMWFRDDGRLSIDQTVDYFAELMFNGIKAREDTSK